MRDSHIFLKCNQLKEYNPLLWEKKQKYFWINLYPFQFLLQDAIISFLLSLKGAEFLSQHIKNKETQKCAFAVTKSGDPIKYQRTIFTECFYVLGMSELFKASNSDHFKVSCDYYQLIWISLLVFLIYILNSIIMCCNVFSPIYFTESLFQWSNISIFNFR